MYVLDTDTYSKFLRGQEPITNNVLRNPNPLYLSAITVEELIKGRIAVINTLRSKRDHRISQAYDYLLDMIKGLNSISILRYDEEAEKVFQAWSSRYKLIGSQDCRIAAVAYVNNFTVVTCNNAHFSKITEVKCEDWSQE